MLELESFCFVFQELHVTKLYRRYLNLTFYCDRYVCPNF